MTITIAEQLRLGQRILKNRLCKPAMSEALARDDGKIGPEILKLYEVWGQGGLAMNITGNVMVDQRAKNEPGVVVIEDESDLPALRQWAEIGDKYDMALIVQLSHPGKQCPRGLNAETVAPSAIGYESALSAMFGAPRELTGAEIEDIIRRFGESARICEKAGFAGVEIHGAHGYLVSSFLSSKHNRRTDQWGGSIENRMRFVLEIYKEIRRRTSDGFLVGVKLNSADFQKGGFTEDESLAVFKALDALGIDFMEVSGGTYENPAMTGLKPRGAVKESTRLREAYFLDFCEKLRKEVKTKLLLTGGFRTRAGMDAALQSGACDLIGVARPLAVEPDAPMRLLAGENVRYANHNIRTGASFIDSKGLMEIIWYAAQFRRIGRGARPDPHLSPLLVFLRYSGISMKDMLFGRKTALRNSRRN